MSENSKTNMIGKYEIRNNLDPKGFGEVYLGFDTVDKKFKISFYNRIY